MSNEDYTERFKECQSKKKSTLQRPPVGCQNWSYQKSVNFKKLLKKVESAIKLVPKAKHAEFLKVEHIHTQLEQYYK